MYLECLSRNIHNTMNYDIRCITVKYQVLYCKPKIDFKNI